MNVVENEKRIIKYWEENNIFRKSVEQRPKNKQFVFYDGPPFATGLPHYGHILGLTSKDVFPRYWTMKGYRCDRRWGWDCHGLPIENIAEQDLGIDEKKEIEEYGVKKFNDYCRSKVLGYAEEWGKTVKRMGKWIEFKKSYKTMDKNYMETVWWIFKKLYDEGYVYDGKKILMYCPRCETPISKAEIAMDKSYKNITEKSPIVKFRMKNTSVLAWTTTPWTLIGNIALAVNPRLKYVKINMGGEILVLAEKRLDIIKEDYEIVEEFKGEELVGEEYEPLYELTKDDNAYKIVDGGNEVSAEEGTGIVHLAIYGEFDYEMIKKYGLPVIQHLNNSGRLEKGPEEWQNLFFKKIDKKIITNLENRDLLYNVIDYSHEYPFCYRCETPLFYNAVDSWFINIQKIKKNLLKKAEEINWHPSHIKHGRFQHIIETAPDWTISRNRFWATAIPVWKCIECDNIKVIGSMEELKKNASERIEEVDLHKDFVDKIFLECDDCGGMMKRVPEVIDCWLESGSMPYAAKHYPFENKEWFKNNFPADFVSEYVGQVRAWFYYMHVMGVLLFNKPPFKNVVVTGNVLASDGSKMSKSKKNFPDPNKMFEKYGADSVRFYLMNSPLMRGEDLNFKEEGLDEVFKKIILLLSNIHKFYEIFNNDNKVFDYNRSEHVLDKWIMSRSNNLIKKATIAMNNYDTITTCELIKSFINDLSTWYVRRSRDRFRNNDMEAVKTLAYVLDNLIKIMSPITPFITEHIYQHYGKKESVHLEKWPEYDEELIDEELNEEMNKVRNITSMALDERSRKGIKVRQPLKTLVIKGVTLSKKLIRLVKKELNVKEIKIKKESEELSVELDTKITPELMREGIIRDLMRKINHYRKKKKLTLSDRIKLYIKTSDKDIKESVDEFREELKESIQADEIFFEEIEESKNVKIRDSEIKLGIQKL